METQDFDPNQKIFLQNQPQQATQNEIDQNAEIYNEDENPQIAKQPTGNFGTDGIIVMDETIKQSVVREVNDILLRLKAAVMPMKNDVSVLLKDWDFLIPFINSVFLGLFSSFNRTSKASGVAFLLIFISVWVGSFVSNIIGNFVGLELSFTQMICVVGYCMLPLVGTAFVNMLLSFLPTILKLLIVFGGVGYASYGK